MTTDQRPNDTMPASQLIGKRITVVVNEPPCRCWLEGASPLVENTTGRVLHVLKMPNGPVAVIEDADGRRLAFDLLDANNGRILIELEDLGQ